MRAHITKRVEELQKSVNSLKEYFGVGFTFERFCKLAEEPFEELSKRIASTSKRGFLPEIPFENFVPYLIKTSLQKEDEAQEKKEGLPNLNEEESSRLKCLFDEKLRKKMIFQTSLFSRKFIVSKGVGKKKFSEQS